MLTNNTFRLFVSSTFSDFIAERDALQTRVFPRLEKYCAERGARFQAVDLRWGITEDIQRQHDTLRICLEEIRRCQVLSPRPNFVALLGDRYGWEPVPARIPLDHWNQLKDVASADQFKLIDAEYQLDENAVPPIYCLRPQTKKSVITINREKSLLQALRSAAEHFIGSDRLPYFASATHQEIVLGALDDKDSQDHVYVYVRGIADMPNNVSAQEFIDWDSENEQVDQEARHKLRKLKSELRQRLEGRVCDMQAHWNANGGGVDEAYLDQFCEMFYQHQITLIDAELQLVEEICELDERQKAHANFGIERSRVFVGREQLLSTLFRYTNTQSEDICRPVILLGKGGEGKSALLAKAVEYDRKQLMPSQAVIVERYIGGVPGTESLMAFITSIMADLANLYSQPTPAIPVNTKDLAEGLVQALNYATAERPLHLYLDALDQLNSQDEAWLLEWLPKELPEYAKVVATVRIGTPVEKSARQRYLETIIEVLPLSLKEGQAMLDAWLADTQSAWFSAGNAPTIGRKLTAKQRETVLNTFLQNGSALWLKMAYEEVCNWTSWDKARTLPVTVTGMIEDLIDYRLLHRESHPKVFTERALAYLTAGRFGVSEDELARVMATDETVRNEFQVNERTQRKWDHEKKLPPVLWSRLYFDLQPYLGLAKIDGALLMRWFHLEFSEILQKKYLAAAENRQMIHGALADTFQTLEREFRPNETNDDVLFRATDVGGTQVSAALRRVMEQPWQLAQAGKQQELQGLLTDFGFCFAKCAANQSSELFDELLQVNVGNPQHSHMGEWQRFFRKQAHILRRGDRRWPAHKIMLQLANEEAEDSSISQVTKQWLTQGYCDWVWVRNKNRPQHQSQSALLVVMEGHSAGINGAQMLSDGRILSWSFDGTLRIWDGNSGRLLALLEGHTTSIKGATVLFDDRKILTWSYDDTLRLWDGNSGQPLAKLEGHSESINGVEVLSGGRVVSWSDDGTLRLWDSNTYKPLAVLEGHTGSIDGVNVLFDGRILSWSDDGTLRLWDGNTGRSLAVFKGHADSINQVKVLSDGRILSWSGDGTLRLWDGNSGQSLAVLGGHSDWVRYAQVFSDGRILSLSDDNTLRLWDGNSGQPLAVLEGHTRWVVGAEVLADNRILSWSMDGTLRLWDSKSCQPLAVLEGHNDSIKSAKVLADGRILSWSMDSTLRLWDGNSGQPLDVLEGHTGIINGVQVLSDGRILSWSDDGTLRLWDGNTGRSLAVFKGHAKYINGVSLLTDGRILSWSGDGTLRLWDVDNRQIEVVLEENTSWVLGADVLPDGRILSWYEDGSLRLWGDNRAQTLLVFEGHTKRIGGVEALFDGRILSWSRDGTLRLWDGNTGEPLSVLMGHTMRISNARMLPDGRILSWSADYTLRLWDGNTGEPLAVLMGHTMQISNARMLSDGRILSWSMDSTLRLWDGISGQLLAVLEGHTRWVVGAEVLADGRILSWSNDGTLRLWHGKSYQLLVVIDGHSDSIRSAKVLEDGRILSWSDDASLRLWNGNSGQPIALHERHAENIMGAEILVDSRILWWSSDNVLHIWDMNTNLIQVYQLPWIETVPYPSAWEDFEQIANAQRFDDVWIERAGDFISLANRQKGWIARWYHDPHEVSIAGISGSSYVLSSSRQVIFLELMYGGFPLVTKQMPLS